MKNKGLKGQNLRPLLMSRRQIQMLSLSSLLLFLNICVSSKLLPFFLPPWHSERLSQDTSPIAANYQTLNQHEADSLKHYWRADRNKLTIFPCSERRGAVLFTAICFLFSFFLSLCNLSGLPGTPRRVHMAVWKENHMFLAPLGAVHVPGCNNVHIRWTETKNGFPHLSTHISFEDIIIPSRGVKWESVNSVCFWGKKNPNLNYNLTSFQLTARINLFCDIRNTNVTCW